MLDGWTSISHWVPDSSLPLWLHVSGPFSIYVCLSEEREKIQLLPCLIEESQCSPCALQLDVLFSSPKKMQAENWCSIFPLYHSDWPLGLPPSLSQILFSGQACIKLVSVEATRDVPLWSRICRCVPQILLAVEGASAGPSPLHCQSELEAY